MFDEPLELSDVLAKLKRADESLAEFIAPLWPGVVLAAAWIEGKPRLFSLEGVPEDREGYFLLGIDEERARVLREAEEDEIRRYRGYLTKATVILLEDGLAYPASSVERLQGIIAPRPIHFAEGVPLTKVKARYDGLNLLFDSEQRPGKSLSPLEDLFAGVPTITPDELLGIPGPDTAVDEAKEALCRLHQQPDLAIEYRLKAVLDVGGATLIDWAKTEEGIRVHWGRPDEEHTVTLRTPNAPITSGISLAGARAFDPATLIRLLIEHVLDAWR